MVTLRWKITFFVLAFASAVNAEDKVVVVPLSGNDGIASAYKQSVNLNDGPHDIATGPAVPLGIPIGPAVVFTKKFKNTVIEAFMMSAVKVDSISAEAPVPFIHFSILANGQLPNFGNRAGLTNTRPEDHLSVMSVFTNLPKGQHTIQIYAKTNSIALGVELDPDNLGGKLIVKEVQ